MFDKKLKFFEIEKKDEETFWNLYDKIPTAKEYQTDGYKAYAKSIRVLYRALALV